jgi:hypothetical protein
MSLRDELNKELKSLNKSKYIQRKKPKVPEIDLDELNELLKEPTDKARDIFKSNFKKGGLVKKGKPKLAKRGWK